MSGAIDQLMEQATAVLPALRSERLAYHRAGITAIAARLRSLRQELSARSKSAAAGSEIGAEVYRGMSTRELAAEYNKIHAEWLARSQLARIYVLEDLNVVQIGPEIRALCYNEACQPLLFGILNDLDLLYLSLMHLRLRGAYRGSADQEKSRIARDCGHLLASLLVCDAG